MRHNKNFNHLGRQAGHRKAMLSNMATSLILHKRIETTVAKAKAVQRFVEPLVTKSKEDTTHSRRIVFSYLKQKEAVTELFRTIAPKISERPGGYTRILKTGFRCYDNDGISCLKGILSTRNDDLSLSVNRCYQKVWPCFHILQTDADHTAILVHDKLKSLHTVFHQLIQRLNVAYCRMYSAVMCFG